MTLDQTWEHREAIIRREEREEGREEGRAEGRAEGIEKGREEGRAELLGQMVQTLKEQGFSEEQISKVLESIK